LANLLIIVIKGIKGIKGTNMYFAEIIGWGKCLPDTILTNDELSTFVDTSDQWIQSRTGIKARRISHVETSDMATVAAQHAIAAAGILTCVVFFGKV
jgi:3-oxoacyl-[acyl-carrier-protein] synthase III